MTALHSRQTPPVQISSLILGVCAACAVHAEFTDDFNSGNDAGWTHYEPIASFGAPVTYSFPSGGYQISVAGSPLPLVVGPGRGGSFRTDCVLTDFQLSYDLVAWGTTPAFAGGFARVSDLGVGTTDGYALGFDFSDNTLFISRVRNEDVEAVVASTAVAALDPSHQYQLTYWGVGTQLAGTIRDLTAGVDLATVSGIDDAYSVGIVGLGVVVQSLSPGIGGTATFDNFSASVPEPSSWVLMVVGSLALVGWTRRSNR
ncbi:MAG TPA: PEP-CTERM sorting domain-containing protein [Verrucomicrobiota bacterium]|nr:hypothetical protein [Verrucomicrobiales bacterium]HRI14653.1 PEP-CTERM sorting domain-containing protein [Verrucomicrobiota bacterium]